MQISENIHQIPIFFQVTEEVRRYVYLYLITGRRCWLIDSGVSGSEEELDHYMKGIGRSLSEIEGICLTHAHPDHMGGAAAIKKASGCQIWASREEKPWIENIRLQFSQRPIPNFCALLNESVPVDRTLKEGDALSLEEGVTLSVLETPGHSAGSLSYLWRENGILFTGDAVPAPGEAPILTDVSASFSSLKKLEGIKDLSLCCPAWDRAYAGPEFLAVLRHRTELLAELENCVREAVRCCPDDSVDERSLWITERMGWGRKACNPLFKRSVQAFLEA